jgi:hypothetical protein
MTGKNKNLYLALTLICFIGIILIFVFDGYMGLYDTATITVGEFPQTIGFEQWQEQARNNFIPSTGIGYGQQGVFRYEIANRRFSAYNSDINVSVWRNQQKIADILTEALNVRAFGSVQVAWNFIPSVYLPDELPVNTSAEFTLLITHGDTERKIIINVYSTVGQPGIKIPPPSSGG